MSLYLIWTSILRLGLAWLALFCAEEGFLFERVIRYKGRGIGMDGWIGIGVGRHCNAQFYLLSSLFDGFLVLVM
jgi:hypothetical protein